MALLQLTDSGSHQELSIHLCTLLTWTPASALGEMDGQILAMLETGLGELWGTEKRS